MYEYIEDRVLEVANYIVESGATVRQAAKKFGISKSTVHKDMSERLRYIDPNVAEQVREVLQKKQGRAAYARRHGYIYEIQGKKREKGRVDRNGKK